MAMKGLDNLVRQMKEMEKAISALDGDIASVSFDPNDPQSIELAIQQVEAAIDEKVGNYGKNEMITGIINELKERYRQEILDRAASGRIEGMEGS
jgi:tRNA threonylcarbamoyladenosine modification (KEOPS) complex Cgi121 subunit